jgi:hypothetical protein
LFIVVFGHDLNPFLQDREEFVSLTITLREGIIEAIKINPFLRYQISNELQG